jgi:hypothetical protein
MGFLRIFLKRDPALWRCQEVPVLQVRRTQLEHIRRPNPACRVEPKAACSHPKASQ